MPRRSTLTLVTICTFRFLLSDTAAADLDTASLVDAIDAVRARHGVPAFSVVVTDAQHTLLAETRGLADVASRRPANADTRFRIGSITKTFTSMAMLIAEADGDLSLDSRIRDITPDALYTNPWADADPIRVAHLLEHSAGFQDWIADEWDSAEPLALDVALAFRPTSRTCRWPPGRFSSYSNSGAGLAAHALEVATGTTYEDFVRHRIFGPLGMSTATLTLDAPTERLLAGGYQSDGVEVIPYWHMLFRPAAAINLNPRDMAAFIRLLLNHGGHEGQPFLSRLQIERMERPRTTLAARAGLQYGYGPGIYQWQRDGHSFFGHGGDADGYLAHFGYSREAGLGYFVVINAFDHRPLRAMRKIIEQTLIRALPAAVYPPTADLPIDLPVTGRYEAVTTRFPGSDGSRTLEVIATQGRLYTRMGGNRRQLVPVTERLFRRPHQSVPTIVLFRAEDDRTYLLGGPGAFRRHEDASKRSGPQDR